MARIAGKRGQHSRTGAPWRLPGGPVNGARASAPSGSASRSTVSVSGQRTISGSSCSSSASSQASASVHASLDTSSGQRAGRRGAVGAGSNRRAHQRRVAGTQSAGPRHRRGGALRVPVHRRDAGHGTRASRRRSQRSSPAAAPASHGRRWPTGSAPPGTAPAPAASGRARARTRSTKRANASTAPQRKGKESGDPLYVAP